MSTNNRKIINSSFQFISECICEEVKKKGIYTKLLLSTHIDKNELIIEAPEINKSAQRLQPNLVIKYVDHNKIIINLKETLKNITKLNITYIKYIDVNSIRIYIK